MRSAQTWLGKQRYKCNFLQTGSRDEETHRAASLAKGGQAIEPILSPNWSLWLISMSRICSGVRCHAWLATQVPSRHSSPSGAQLVKPSP